MISRLVPWLWNTSTGLSETLDLGVSPDKRDRYRALLFLLKLYRYIAWALLGWAVAAGTWRTWQTVFPGGSTNWNLWTLIETLCGAGFFIAGAAGSLILIFLSMALLGGLFGFLFGSPRLSISAHADSADGTAVARNRMTWSPALTEISDWLTKIIIGLGLVQAGSIASGFWSSVGWLLQAGGLGRFPLAGVIVPFAMFSGALGGTIFGYLVTVLVVGPQLAAANDDIESTRERVAREKGFVAGKTDGFKEGREEGLKAGRDEGFTAGKEEGFAAGKEGGLKAGRDEGFAAGKQEGFEAGQREGSATARRDAEDYATAVSVLRPRSLSMLFPASATRPGAAAGETIDPGLAKLADTIRGRRLEDIATADEIRAWAKAQVLSGNIAEAKRGLDRLLAMDLDLETRRAALIDYADVCSALDQPDESHRALEQAKLIPTPEQLRESQRAIAECGVPRVLYDVPQDKEHAREALERLGKTRDCLAEVFQRISAAHFDPWAQTWRACVLGQINAALMTLGRQNESEAEELRQEAKVAIAAARQTGQSLEFLQLLMDPNHPKKKSQLPEERENDLESFYDYPELKKLLEPWPVPGDRA